MTSLTAPTSVHLDGECPRYWPEDRLQRLAREAKWPVHSPGVNQENGAVDRVPLGVLEGPQVSALLIHDGIRAGHPGGAEWTEGDGISGDVDTAEEAIAGTAAGGFTCFGNSNVA